MIKLRASALPSLYTCPSSHAPCKHPVSADSEPAARGRSVHSILGAMVLTGDLAEIEDSETGMLCAFGRQAWGEVKDQFPDPQVEAANDYVGGGPDNPWHLTGHVDVFSLGVVLDFKSGRKRSDYTPQMKGYALLFGARRAVIVWLRDREFEVVNVSDHDAIEREITEKVSQIGKVFNPGEHCVGRSCPRINECEAYRDFSRIAIAPFLPVAQHEDYPADRMRVAQAYKQAKAVGQMLKRFDVLLKADIDKRGPLDLGGGQELFFNEKVTSPLDPAPALRILLGTYTQDEVAKCLTIGKGNLKALVQSKAEKGCKGKDWMELMERLVAADAVIEKTTRVLASRKKEAE